MAVCLGAARDHGCQDAAATVVAARCEATSFRGRPGRGQAPVQGHPRRSESGNTEGVGAVTTLTTLPSMIRVDATGRMDVVYDEVSEALGEEPGFFDQAEFEENMSTHYGRMIHTDDRTILVANPEDAADYLGFDLTAS